MEEAEGVGVLEKESLKRKERLNALKNKLPTPGEKSEERKALSLPKPKFRSYKPIDENLKELKKEDPKPGNVEAEVKEQLEAANHRVVLDNLDISNLAPRKPDWDLKRDAAKKLERLERRTQRAIAELIRERLQAAGEDDLANNVTIGAELQAAPDEE